MKLHGLHRAANSRRSQILINGMVLLVALCGWAVGGEQGAHWAIRGGTGRGDAPPLSPEGMLHQFGARLLRPWDWPELFATLAAICRRAGLPRLPDLYYLPDPHSMNAYALGGPERSAITLTEGLLRGMTMAEIAGILAHEVGHIRNNDGWALNLAATLYRATWLTAAMGSAQQPAGALAALLSSAPLIGQLMQMALSRIRELDADAVALELVGDAPTLVMALSKLERHHSAGRPRPATAPAQDPSRLLRSHPDTGERVGILLRLAAR